MTIKSKGSSVLAIDAGTLSGRKFLNYVLCTPENKPYLLASYEKESLTIEDYKRFTKLAVIEARNARIHIIGIVGDNLPVQIKALAHWIPTSLLRESDFSPISGMLYWPCLCHTTELIISVTAERNHKLSRLISTLKKMVSIARLPKVKARIGSTCPLEVATRWLSRFQCVQWMMKNQAKIMAFSPSEDESQLTDEQQEEFDTIFTEANFGLIALLGKLLRPFYSIILFFERDDTRQYHAIPVFESLQTHLSSMKESPIFSDFVEVIDHLLTQLTFRQQKTLHYELLTSIYVLTPEGRIWLRAKIRNENPIGIEIDDTDELFVSNFQFIDFAADLSMEDVQLPLDDAETDEYPQEEENAVLDPEIVQESHHRSPEREDDRFAESIPEAFEEIPDPPVHLSGEFTILEKTLKETAQLLHHPGEHVYRSIYT
jgi:hypothetical protein